MLLALKGAPLSVLVYMTHDPRPVGPVELAAATGYSRPTIAMALRRLESLGMLTHTADRTDAWVRVHDVKISYIDAPIYNYYNHNDDENARHLLEQVIQWHGEEIGPATKAIRSKLAALVTRHTNADHWREAFEAAATQNKRSLAYVIKCVQSRGTLLDNLQRAARQLPMED